jgi:hypothetical protein
MKIGDRVELVSINVDDVAYNILRVGMTGIIRGAMSSCYTVSFGVLNKQGKDEWHFFPEELKLIKEGEKEVINLELHDQIDKLANFIMENIPGEPSRNEGAIDTVIRLLKKWKNFEVLLKALKQIVELGKDMPDPTQEIDIACDAIKIAEKEI